MEPTLSIEIERYRLNFLKFVDDCIVYCLEKSGLQYTPLDIPDGHVKYFTADYGDAVLQYQGAHEEMYRKHIREKSSSKVLVHEGLQDYMFNAIIRCFESSTIMEGILKFCSLFVDTAIFCFRYEKSELINQSLIPLVGFVFDNHVIRLFTDSHYNLSTEVMNEVVRRGISLVNREREVALRPPF